MSTTTKMPYVRLGNSGLKVSKIILGCMSYGDPRWQEWVLPEEEAIKHIKYAYDHGITTFDTAKGSASFRLHAFIYSHGQSEIILGNAIKKLNLPRDELVILTKVYFPIAKEGARLDGNPEDSGIINQHGLNRKHIFDSVKASLKRLQLDYIDVLQCHRFDYTTPIEETMPPRWSLRGAASRGAKRRFYSILAESSRIAGAALEEDRTPEAASPHSLRLLSPVFAPHQRALQSITQNPHQNRREDLGWSDLTRF
ncbi:transporter [Ganoderma sinense ZZ0214-1]|uniref:Transporter n=1 Tax=Ganoderma sinense ZZ0214-1 TaxID=1077348 RepID=A0A2G8SHM3_9APHY|nr:transporter [Ganoderma sinense ZZ0214-1]